MFCPKCGAGVPDGVRFCPACGAAQSSPVMQDPRPAYPSAPACSVMPINENRLPPQYRPLSAWAYFGYSILYSIPLIGFIVLIANALNDSNINRRNHARSFFCGLVLAAILGVFLVILALILGINFREITDYGI